MGAETLGYHLPWYFALAMWAGWMTFVVLIVVIGRRRRLRKRTAPQLGRSNARLKGLPPAPPSNEVVTRQRRFSRR